MAKRRPDSQEYLADIMGLDTSVTFEPAPNLPDASAAKEGDVDVLMDLNDIHEHPENYFSIDEGEIENLARDIRKNGLLQTPLCWVNKKGQTELLAGHRRRLAYKWLRDNVDSEKYAKMPVRIRTDIESESKAYMILVSANLQTRDITPLERVRGILAVYNNVAKMREEDASLDGERSRDIASRKLKEEGYDVSPSTVQLYVNLNDKLIGESKEIWNKGIITMKQAGELTKIGEEGQRKFCKLVLEKNITEELSKEAFSALRSEAVASVSQEEKPDLRRGKTKTPAQQFNGHVSTVKKLCKSLGELKEHGADLNPSKVAELKEYVKALDEFLEDF